MIEPTDRKLGASGTPPFCTANLRWSLLFAMSVIIDCCYSTNKVPTQAVPGLIVQCICRLLVSLRRWCGCQWALRTQQTSYKTFSRPLQLLA